MTIDWTLVARFAGPVLGAVVGWVLARFMQRRPKLLSYLAHSAATAVQPPEGPAVNVNTHSIVIRNGGRLAAHNVRIGHYALPNFSVFPSIQYEVHDLPSGGKEIHFPVLVPGEQVTIAYLYFPPLFWHQVHSYTKSDEGFARVFNVLPSPPPPPWLRRLLVALVIVGSATIVYALVEFILW